MTERFRKPQTERYSLDKKQTLTLVNDLARGMTKVEAAAKYGVSVRTIYRTLARGGKTYRKQLKPCGTVAAYQRHLHRGEIPCPECTKAKAAYEKNRMKEKRDG